MSTAAIPRDTQSAVERYFEVWLFLLVLTGFVTLAATGKLDLLSLLFVGAALVFRGYLLAKRETLTLDEQWTTYLTLGYVVFYLADFFLISRSFVGASVHLVLFSMVVKIFSVQRDRDLLYLAVLSFLEVLAAAVLTVDSVFLIAFAVFLLVAVATFMALEMRRTARRTAMVAREHAQSRRFGRALRAITRRRDRGAVRRPRGKPRREIRRDGSDRPARPADPRPPQPRRRHDRMQEPPQRRPRRFADRGCCFAVRFGLKCT